MNETQRASVRARAAILGRLRAAAAAPVETPAVAAYYDRAEGEDGSDRIQRFVAQARGWQAEVVETDDAGWPAALARVLAAKGVRRLLAGRGTALATGLRQTDPGVTLDWYDAPIEHLKPALFDSFDAGITTTRGGIAETGSLILWPDAQEPRTLSLVPPLHIAVLRADSLYPTLHAAMAAQGWADGLPTNALLVTGPSKTADIQRLLVYGAHGPRQLVILLLRARDGA